jgi:hypothetical protein
MYFSLCAIQLHLGPPSPLALGAQGYTLVQRSRQISAPFPKRFYTSVIPPNEYRVAVFSIFVYKRTMNWRPFSYNHITYDLSHLDEFVCTYVQPEKNGLPARSLQVKIEFSFHCFTHDPKPTDPPGLLYPFPRDLSRRRAFDFDRWHLSKQLPGVIRCLMNQKCRHSAHRNFFIVTTQDLHGNTVQYEVFFRVALDSNGQLVMNVESAYVRDRVGSKQPDKGSVYFNMILTAALDGKVLRPTK